MISLLIVLPLLVRSGCVGLLVFVAMFCSCDVFVNVDCCVTYHVVDVGVAAVMLRCC